MSQAANSDIEAALRYHALTNHTEAKLRSDPHRLDWDNQPLPFKIYRHLESVALPGEEGVLAAPAPALDALALSGDAPRAAEKLPDLQVLARLLYLGAGITKRKPYPGGEMYFRAYPNTGALYHIDLYVVCGDLPGLEAGVYQFAVHEFALTRLRSGDYRRVLVEASGQHPRVAEAPLTLVSASTYWRNAWKYRARAYRHCFWDGGTLHANLLAVAATEGLSPSLVLGFADAEIERLLALDPEREGALSLVPLGRGEPPPPTPPLPELALETVPLSRTAIDYPPIRSMHAASSLPSGEAAAAWRGRAPVREPPPARGPLEPLKLPPEPARTSLARTIVRRGSTRAFDTSRSLPYEALSLALERATRGVPGDFLDPFGTTLLDHYLIVHAVDGLEPGSYYYRHEEQALERLRAGEFRAEAGRLGLGQRLPANAVVNVYALAHLPSVLERFGNRGYRAAQMEGGIAGGRLYLAAYAQRLGASGLTFFDDEVIEFFSPHAAGKSVMFLTALGYADRRVLGLAG